MLLGYARVSTKDQDLTLQTDALTKAGCERIFTDHGVSGAALTKPGLTQALDFARVGDTLVVWRLDRLSRNFFDLQQRVEALATAKLGFISLKETIDTTRPMGDSFSTSWAPSPNSNATPHMSAPWPAWRPPALKVKKLAGQPR